MKNKLLKLTIMVSKHLLFWAIIVVITAGTLWANSGNAQDKAIKSVKENMITLHLKGASLMEIMNAIEVKTGYKFTYDKNEIDRKLRMDIVFEGKSVEDVLLEVSKIARLRFRQVNNNIHVKKIQGDSEQQIQKIEVVIQARTVSGKVTSPNGETLPGVNVLEKGTRNGTVTDLDGNYTLEVTEGATLVFSSVGYQTTEREVGTQSVINLTLTEDVRALDEIVVIGYGTQRERDLTSAITTIRSEEIVKTPAGQVMQSLQGKVAGVQIVNTGDPGSEPTVRIRGIGSFPGISNSSPLYVVDGMFFNNIDFLNPADIESLSVLKDASAAAIYGVRAANGVVLITTRKGMLNTESTITYEGYIGVQVPQNVLKMANAEQFVNYVNQTGSAADIQFVDQAMQRYGRSRVNPNVPDVNTDWYAEIMHTEALQQNHALTILGGGSNTAYSLGVSYFDQEGLLKTKNSYQRMNIRGQLDHKVNNWLNAGVNVNLSNGIRYIGNRDAWFNAYHAVPILPKYDLENYDQLVANEVPNASAYASAKFLGYRNPQNPFFNLDYADNRLDIRKAFTGIYTEIAIIPDKLTFKTTYNISLSFIKDRNVGLPYWVENDSKRELSTISTSRSTYFDRFLDNILTFNESFGDHNLNVMMGTSYRDEWFDFLSGSAANIPLNENSWYISQSQSQESKIVGDDASRFYGVSYFGRLAYNFKDKYLGYFTIRQEGTSKYQEKWGTFPAFGLGWVISEESFFQGVGAVDFLKFRGGWGQLGNDRIPPQTGANTTNPHFFAIDDTQVTGTVTTSTFGYLEWERNTGTNIGISARLLNNRLSIESDYFIRDTENAAIPVNLKLQSGNVLRNQGKIRNSGFELALNWNSEITNDLRLLVGTNIATLKNEVLDLFGQQYINGGMAEFRQRAQVGEPLFSFYGYEVEGVYQNQGEIDADPIAVANNLVPGDFKFRDQDGNDILNDDDKVFLGSYFPDLTYGGTLGLLYKNLEFSMNIMGQRGNKILNRKRGEIIWTNDTNFDADLATGLWNGEGTSNKYPSAAGLRRGWNQNFSDYLVEAGAFFRIQNIQVAYNFNLSQLLGQGMPDVRVYFTAEKPLTVFKYNGFTPEVPDGVDRQFYPVPAVYTMGLNLKF